MMNNFLQRSLTGAAYVIVIILSLITHPLVFILLTGLLNLLALLEFRKMDKTLSANKPVWIYLGSGLLTASLILSYEFINEGFSLIGLLVMVIFLFIFGMYKSSEHSWNFIMRSIFSILYISLPLSLLCLLHFETEDENLSMTLILFILIWTNDSLAYFWGLLLGKHRLFERISPKKSWEGFFGGLFSTALAVYVLAHFNSRLEILEWIILGVLCVLAGVFGDFIESVLKRHAKVKDSGNLLPGHGGILDRIDSLLLVSPVIFVYFYLLNSF